MHVIDKYKNFFADSLLVRGVSKLAKSDSVKNYELEEGASAVSPEDAQVALRRLFGKSDELPETTIGGHPDFDHLEDTGEIERASVVTLFMDIESSTRLGVLYSPEDVFKIKNTFIQMAIGIIRALDGHVHRIMGDAVMAFFGGSDTGDDDVIDAINCGSVLQYIVKKSIIPKLEELGYTDSEFGIKVGLDYGDDKDVLWSSYGLPDFSEVTATSFFVDVASKLQSQAGRNQVMLGQSIVDKIDFPEKLLSVKQVIKNGASEDCPYILPNVTNADGEPINYKKFILNTEEYLKKTAFPVGDGDTTYLPVANNSFSIRIEVLGDDQETKISDMLPGSFSVQKGCWIKFSVSLNYQPQLPVKFIFEVENHGEEARSAGKREDGSSNFQNHVTEQDRPNYKPPNVAVHKEQAKYRGLQYMTIKVKKGSGKTLHKQTMGIFIK